MGQMADSSGGAGARHAAQHCTPEDHVGQGTLEGECQGEVFEHPGGPSGEDQARRQ